MSAGSIIGGGIGLVRTRPQLVAIWAAIYLAVGLLGVFAMRPWTAAMLAFQQQAAANGAAGINAAPAFPAQLVGLVVLIELAWLVALIIAFAAVVRAVTRPAGDRFAYLRLGMDELRLLGLFFLFVIAGLAVEIVAFIAFAILGGVIGLVAGKVAAVIVGVVFFIALLCAVIFVEVRLSLAGALTVMRGKIIIGDAWRATRGHFWTLFGVYLLMFLAFFAATIVVVALTNPHLLAAYAAHDPRAITAAAQERLTQQDSIFSVAMLTQLVLGSILGAIMGAVACGAIATAAVELGGTNNVDEMAEHFR